MGDWITSAISSIGYLGVLLLMLLETVFPPIPSELIMPLAGYLVSQGEMTLWGAVLAGTVGSTLGALALYWCGRRIGERRLKNFVDRHGRWLTISRNDVDRISGWFERHGGWTVLVCRMIPGLRSLISIPAGIHRMNVPKFLLYTVVGTALWTALLVCAGYLLGSRFEQVGHWLGPVTNAVLLILLVIYVWRVVTHKGAPAPPD